LLDRGFSHVVAVDAEPGAGEVLKHVPDDCKGGLEFVHSSFDEFEFGQSRYDLINAQFALPFNPPETFDEMFDRLKQSLKSGGVFVGTLYGENDEWNKPGDRRTFHSRLEVEELLEGLETLIFEEEDNPNGQLANGTPKHWHSFMVIARRPYDGESS
jgi:SAM-dependent methyltransferase